MILAVQRLDRGQTAQPAEILFRQDPDAARRLGVGLFSLPKLEAPGGLAWRPTRTARCGARPDHQHRRTSRHVVDSDTAQTFHQLARLALAKRRQFARKDDDLTVKRGIEGVRFFGRWQPHRTACGRGQRIRDAPLVLVGLVTCVALAGSRAER